ncbi:MAG TPA: hypothetical protein VN924_08490 [Bryobacteraceae bacterium]|nr:hypothetical protein [Bryobacteraceae bacterium]
MNTAAVTTALAGMLASSALAQAPSVTGVLNNYSYTLPSLPNYGIAQGSIFAIFGTNLAAQPAAQTPPLQVTVAGVTVDVTVNGTTTRPLLYYVSPSQIDAVLPSATPAGTGTVSVTNGQGASATFPIVVVSRAFGLATANSGAGQALGFDASNGGALFGFMQAVNPGEILELWGTGLGPVAGDATDVAVVPAPQVFIGGMEARALYAGRSSYTGLDQINVQVPAGMSGCYVSVVVQTGTYVSNFATLPVAASGRACSDSWNPLPAGVFQKISQTGTANIGVVQVTQTTGPNYDALPTYATHDAALGSFVKLTAAQLSEGASASGAVVVSPGSCVVNFATAGAPLLPPLGLFQFAYLSAGPELYGAGPEGDLTMPPLTPLAGIPVYGNFTLFVPPSGGNFNFGNTSGGADVGSFNVSLQVPPAWTWVDWQNMNSIFAIPRAGGITLDWTGGDPSTYVSVNGVSYGSMNGGTDLFVLGDFTCLAPTSAGAFTVPPVVLQALPVSYNAPISQNLLSSTLSLSYLSAPAPFAAEGLDAAWAQSQVTYSILVSYQ